MKKNSRLPEYIFQKTEGDHISTLIVKKFDEKFHNVLFAYKFKNNLRFS